MSAAETKQGHTPGAWEVHVAHDVTGYPCFFIHGFAGDAKRDTPTLEANARLIAAAPELLESLVALLDVVSFAKSGPDAEIHLRAEAAIRKAKGSL